MLLKTVLDILLLSGMFLIGYACALKEDKRRKTKVVKMTIPEDIEQSLDETEIAISKH